MIDRLLMNRCSSVFLIGQTVAAFPNQLSVKDRNSISQYHRAHSFIHCSDPFSPNLTLNRLTVCSVVLLFFFSALEYLTNSNLMIILIAFSLSPQHRNVQSIRGLSEHLRRCGQIQPSRSVLSSDAICKVHFHKSCASTSKMTSSFRWAHPRFHAVFQISE